MGYLIFYLFYGLNWIITLLPLRILYIFSDILFLLFYYFPAYRKNIVLTNLRNSFPEKSDDEIRRIARQFYRHLADLFPETLKMTHMSDRQLFKRMTFTNPELLNKLYDEGRDLMVVHSHYNCWEWLSILPLYTIHKNVSVYKPLQNKLFDRFLNSLRSKHGMELAPMSGIIREVVRNREKGILSLYALIADQTPYRSEIHYRTTFLNQDTPVFLGPEKIAKKYDMAVIFFRVRKTARGHYNLTAELLFDHTGDLPEHLITETHVRKLEELIRENPQYWLWSHRRWKY